MNIHELSELTGKSVSTIRRHKQKLEEYGAYCGRPAWKITTEQAIKAGLLDEHSLSSHEYSSDYSVSSHASAIEDELRERIKTLETALEREKDRVTSLESILEQEKREKMLWLQGYLSETREIAPAEPKNTEEHEQAPEHINDEKPSLFKRMGKLFTRE